MARARGRAAVRARSRRLLLTAAAGALGIAACVAIQSDAGPADGGGPAVAVRPVDVTTAQQQLGQLRIAEPRPAGYQRTRDFGPAWSYDFDHNGCRERDDVLRRDLSQVRLRDRCAVVSGVLADPYTGRTVQFRKEAADEVQIDHVFPLAAAWAHGARAWPASTRLHFANDPTNLLATTGSANSSKSDNTPAEWQPRVAYRCAYAVRYVRVATQYRLTISVADRRALTGMLGTCPRQP